MAVTMQGGMGPLRPDATDAEIEMAQEYLARLEAMAKAGNEALLKFVIDNPEVISGPQLTLASTEIPPEFQGTFRDRAVNVWIALSESRPVQAIASTAVILGALALGFAAAGKTTTAPSGVVPVVMQPPVFANSSFCPPAMPGMAPSAWEGVGLEQYNPTFWEPEAKNESFFAEEGASNATNCPVFEGAAASADDAAMTLPEEDGAMRPAGNATEGVLGKVALVLQPVKAEGLSSLKHLNASFCPAPIEEEAPRSLSDREAESLCPAGNATEGAFKEVAHVESEVKGRSSLEIAKDVAVGVAIVSGAILKGIAAATATAVGSIFVGGTLME